MKKKIIFLSLILILMISKVSAASEYYDNIWIGSQGSKSNIVYGINDIVETENGYLAVGPYDTFGDFEPTIYVLDQNGKATSQISLGEYNSALAYLDVLRIIEIDGYYYAITESDYISSDSATGESIYHTYFVEMNEKGKILDVITVESSNGFGYGYNDVEIIIKETEKYVYITNNDENGYLRISKEDFTCVEADFTAIPEEDKEAMEDLAGAITDYYVQSEYKDGYFVYIDDNYDEEDNYLTSNFGYYCDGEIKWKVSIYYWNKFVSSGTTVEYNNNLIFVNYDIDKDPVLITIDENGNILEENKMVDYFEGIEDYDYYNFEHIIPGENGFFVTGSYVFLEDAENIYLDERLSQSAPMYFQKKYKIYTQTDGNGNVTSSQEWGFGKETVTFTVTPNEGYVLSEVKVTDSEGNVLIFTDYTFTMPSADVTIEAKFIIEETNPETSDIAIIMAIVIGLVGLYFAIKNKKKIEFINE